MKWFVRDSSLFSAISASTLSLAKIPMETGKRKKEGKRKGRGMMMPRGGMKMRLVITNVGPSKSHAILETCYYILCETIECLLVFASCM